MADTSTPLPKKNLPAPKRGNVAFAFAALVAGNMALAFGALFVRLADVGPVSSAFWRMALALPFIWALAWREDYGRTRHDTPARTRWEIVLPLVAGLFFAADLVSWHVGILQTKLANATLFGNVTSLFLVLYGIILARRFPHGFQALAIILAFAGGALLMGRSFSVSPETLVGDLLSVLAGLFYTFYVLAMRHVRAGGSGTWRPLAEVSSASCVPLLIAALAMGEAFWPGNWWPLIALAVSSQVIGQGFSIYALPHFSPLVIGLSLLLQPVIAAVAGWYLFGETMGVPDFIGAGMIGAALVLVQLPGRRSGDA